MLGQYCDFYGHFVSYQFCDKKLNDETFLEHLNFVIFCIMVEYLQNIPINPKNTKYLVDVMLKIAVRSEFGTRKCAFDKRYKIYFY